MSAVEYTAQTISPAVKGEAKLTIGDKSFTVVSVSGISEIPYAEVNQITFADYNAVVKTDSGDYTFSRMGEWAERFYISLCEAYNKAVLRSMFLKGKPLVTAAGDYSFSENGVSGRGQKTPVYVYDNCVVSLPPDLGARRIPLCFLSSNIKGEFTVTLNLDTGESYTFSKLGYNTDPFNMAVEKQKRTMLEKAIQNIKEIDASISVNEASQLATHMQEGAAVTFSKIISISPGFAAALESKINQTRAGEYYNILKTTCDPSKIYVGFRKNETAFGTSGASGAYMFWLIAPSPNGSKATVEFSEADTATFVYKTCGNFQKFASQLGRALEAIAFKREVIFMDDSELRKPEYADYYMANKRTAALQFVRKNFADRVIHSSPETWKGKLLDIYNKV